jgi:predicted Zn-dependent protease
MLEAKQISSEEDLELMLISVRNACRDLDDIDSAVTVLAYAVKRLPQSYPIRYLYSLDLIASNRAGEAAEHLKWCANRHPDDASLRNMATQAVTERLKHTSSTARKDGDAEVK